MLRKLQEVFPSHGDCVSFYSLWNPFIVKACYSYLLTLFNFKVPPLQENLKVCKSICFYFILFLSYSFL